MYLVIETDKYGTLELATFETIKEAEKFIKAISGDISNNYKIVVRSPLKLVIK